MFKRAVKFNWVSAPDRQIVNGFNSKNNKNCPAVPYSCHRYVTKVLLSVSEVIILNSPAVWFAGEPGIAGG